MKTVGTDTAERALLVGVVQRASRRTRVEEYLDELSLLADSAGAVVVDKVLQDRAHIDAAFFIGKGKAEEIAARIEPEKIDLVVFDDDLSAVQVRNLERLMKCKIIDRSGIILDIFASRARTMEAKTQVELAQMHYMLPRLTRQWTHLSKQFGGIGTKGPGETQIETDRRAIRTKISRLNERLKRIDKEREVQRKGREQYPRVALVGYTNVGKSTILNWFSQADVLVEDRLFATLDSTVRMVTISPTQRILLSDTVGFIRKLPHHLVASFKSTLDEVTEADILLHVVDVSHPFYEEQMTIVTSTLEEIGAKGKPTVTVFNKIDRLTDRTSLPYIASHYPHAAFISASRGINMGALRDRIAELLQDTVVEEILRLGQDDYRLIARIHEKGEVLETSYDGNDVTVRFRMNRTEAEKIKKASGKRVAAPRPKRSKVKPDGQRPKR